MPEWGTNERVEAIKQAIERVPHDQKVMGIGFALSHDPTKCYRCRADISLLELSAQVLTLEIERGVTTA